MHIIKTISALGFGLLLSGCGTLISTPTQEITVNTPGAAESHCVIDNGLRYPVNGGQTISIMRSENPLIIDCYGSGNRNRKMRVSADGNEWAMLNVTNGIVPGLAYDHFGKGLYKYPDVVTIDFTGEPTRGFELPDYHNKDAPNPYEQAIEGYGPKRNRLESDRYATPVVINKIDPRDTQIDASVLTNQQTGFPPVESGVTVSPAATAPQSPALSGGSADELTRSANPDVFDK